MKHEWELQKTVRLKDGRWECRWRCADCGLEATARSVPTNTLVTPLPSDAEAELAMRAEVDAVHDL